MSDDKSAKRGYVPEKSLEGVVQRMKKIEYVCDRKRQVLVRLTPKRLDRRKYLNLLAGCLALLAWLTISAAIVDLLNPKILSLFGAVLAFLSGIISLIPASLFDDQETQQISEAAAAFAGLRNEAGLEALRPNLTAESGYESMKDLYRKYDDLCRRYDRYLPSGEIASWTSAELNLDLPVPDAKVY